MTCPICKQPVLERFDSKHRSFRSSIEGLSMHESCALNVYHEMHPGEYAKWDKGLFKASKRIPAEHQAHLWQELNEWKNNE